MNHNPSSPAGAGTALRETEHTPGKWFVQNAADHVSVTCENQQVAVMVRFPSPTQREANAAHIVLCVNAHDGLVKALADCEMVLTAIECGHDKPLSAGMVLEHARIALRSAAQPKATP